MQFLQDLCIICQEFSENTVTSSEVGRRRVMEAAQIRNNEVLQQINMSDGLLVYHSSNKCYKTYKLKKMLEYLQQTK